MARFYIGQRVRVARLPVDCIASSKCAVGSQGTVAGTVDMPNRGFHLYRDRDLSVLLDGSRVPAMGPSYCFEPIAPSGAAGSTWEECLWRPERLAGVEA